MLPPFLSILVCDIEGWLVPTGCEGAENIGEGGNNGSIVLGGHSANNNGVEVINVCNKDTLHGFEGADGELTR